MIAAVALVAIGLVAPAQPAAAEAPFWTPPPGALPTGTSAIYLTAHPGALTAGPVVDTSTTHDLTVSAANRVGSGALLNVVADGADDVRFLIQVPTTRIAVGRYSGFDEQGNRRPGSFSHLAGNCDTSGDQSEVQIDQATYEGAALVSIDLRFRTTCSYPGVDVYGALSWDASFPIAPSPNPVAIPDGLWRPAIAATPASGNFVYVEGYLPPTEETSRLFTGNTSAAHDYEYSVPADAPRSNRVGFYGTDGINGHEVRGDIVTSSRQDGLRVGWYRDLQGWTFENPVLGGIAVNIGSYSCAESRDGWFAVDEVSYVGRNLTHVSFRFERTCAGNPELDVVRGQVSWSAVPHIDQIHPDHGERRGGEVLMFNGPDLLSVTAASIGGVPATVQRDEFGQIQVVAPPLPLGPHDVVLENPGGTATAIGGYTSVPNHAGAPTDVVALPQPAAAVVTWTPPTDLGDHETTGVEVTLWGTSRYDPPYVVSTVQVGPDETIALVSDLIPGAAHQATVTYLDAEGRGTRSSPSPDIAVPPPDVTPFDEVPTLVTQQFVDFVGRAPTPTERDAAVTSIRTGKVLPEAYVASMRLRPEWGGVRAPMTRLYSAYFGRLPDAAGLTYWGKKLRTGTTLAKASATFASSSEFRRTYGPLSNAAFVDLVYRNVLHRSADASGRAHWIAKLAKGTARGSVMTSFSESSEHVRTSAPTVDAVLLYTGMLRRMPTTAELSGAPARSGRSAPSDPASLAQQLLHSAPYAARF